MPYAESSGAKIHYEVFDAVAPWEARRETIIFHHGIGADPGIWTAWLPILIERYRIVRFDMRGYGRSHIPPPGFHWTLDLLSNDVLAVADAVEARRPHLVGESIGGTIALNCAIKHPSRVATVTVSNGGHVGASIERVQAWQRAIDEHGIKAWSDQFMLDRFHDGALDERGRSWYAARQESWNRDSILNALGVLVGTDLRPQLPGVECPVLLLHPDASPFIPVDVMVDLYHRLANARLQIFANARHGLPFSHAKTCARILREFLDAVTAAR
ncbi:MAG: alpha/beta hydrolase [Betaproteobacteria bacterium]|nr:alpha/beta hydrolase [Betaproteobacteria bacterium]